MSDISLDDKLVETATKVAVTRNEFGDIDYGATTTTPCLYRDQTSLLELANREEVTVDGILWFGASESVARGDIYYLATEGYLRVEKVIKAKTLVTDDTLKFIKCMVSKTRQIS